MKSHLIHTTWLGLAAMAGCVGETEPTRMPETPSVELDLSQTGSVSTDSTATVEFEDVVVTAYYDTNSEQIIADVTDLATTEPRGTLTWHLASGAVAWQLTGEQVSLPVDDLRIDREPSLAQAIQIAHDQWTLAEQQAAGEEVPYCWTCNATCPRLVGMYICHQTVTCSTDVTCTPDGCTEEQNCRPEWRCDWVWDVTWYCCDWECWI